MQNPALISLFNGSRSWRSSALAALLGASALSAQTKPEFTDDLYPGQETRGEEAWIVSRIVDDLTGQAIVGATIEIAPERITPATGAYWSIRSAKSDAEGIVRLRTDDLEERRFIQVLRHPDYGTTTRSEVDPIWRVGRPFDVPVQIMNWRGEPVADAVVGFCGGCGHTPDIAHDTTNKDGIATLAGLDPRNSISDLYVQASGVSLGYVPTEWRPGEPPQQLLLPFVPERTGRVVDADGDPIEGAHVGRIDSHRGPWSTTDENGTYRLLGALGPPLIVVVDDKRAVLYDAPDVSPLTLIVPDVDEDEEEKEEEKEDDGEDEFEFNFDRKDSKGTFEAPVEESPFPPRAAVRIAAQNTETDGELWVRAHWAGEVEGNWVDDLLEVPESGPIALHVKPIEGSDRLLPRTYVFDSVSELPEQPLKLAYFAPTQVTAKIVDAAGKPTDASVHWLDEFSIDMGGLEDGSGPVESKDGALAYASVRVGTTLLYIDPEDNALQPRAVWVNLPHRGENATLDLGTIELRDEPMLRVVGADGKPLDGPMVNFARAGLQTAGESYEAGLTDDGGFEGPDLAAGDSLIVTVDMDALPFRTVLTGEAPWTVTVPDGALDLEVVDDEGNEVPGYVLVDDHAVEIYGRQTYAPLRPGKRRVVISAPEYRTAILEITIGKNPKPVRVVMPRVEDDD